MTRNSRATCMVAGLWLMGSISMAQAQESTPEEVARETARWAIERLRAQPQPSESQVDDRTLWEDPDTNPDGDTTLYYQYMIPGYGTERNEQMMGTLEGIWGNPEACGGMDAEAADLCMEQNASTPAEIHRLAEDHNQQMRTGTNPESQAFQLVEESSRTQPRVQFWNPEDDFHDPIFDIALQHHELGSAVYESLIGDCDTVEVPVYETTPATLSDIQTCHQIFAPNEDEFECQAERQFSASPTTANALLAVLTPVVSNPICLAEAAAAINACGVEKCEEAADIRFESCQIREACSDLTGRELEDCVDGCQDEANNLEAQCAEDAAGCDFIGDETYELCALTCNESEQFCVPICSSQSTTARNQCNSDCDSAGDGAYDQCVVELGPGVFDGLFEAEIPAVGSPSVFSIILDDGEVEVESTPFPGIAAHPSPDFFVADYAIEVDGGDGQILVYAGQSNSQRTRIMVAGGAVSEARLYGTLYGITENRIEGCEEFIDAVADNFCVGTMTCTDPNPNCFELAPGITTCGSGPASPLRSVLVPWHANSETALALAAEGEIQLDPLVSPITCASAQSNNLYCDYYMGEGEGDYNCYTDLNGVERCIVGGSEGLETLLGPEPYLDNCRDLAESDDCNHGPEIHCVEGGEGLVSGRCYVRDIRYECGQNVLIETETQRRRTITCGDGQLICLGDECVTHTQEPSDFQQAVEATAILREMERDFGCMQEDEDTTVYDIGADCDPVFFRGEPMECKVPVGSNVGVTPNCCKEGRDAAAGEGFTQYMDAMTAAHYTGELPGEAWEQSYDEGPEESGAHLNTPDWLAMEDDTEYVPPEWDDGGGGGGGGESEGPGLRSIARESDGRPTAGKRYIDPDNLALADPSYGNYVARGFVSPFETTAAQAGFVPRNREQLEEAKQSARGQSDLSFARAVGLGAQGVLDPDLYDQLYYPNGEPKWVRARNGTIVRNQRSSARSAAGDENGGPTGGGGGSLQAAAVQSVDAGSFASVAKMVSVAYGTYALTKAIGHMIFSCEQEELDLGYARETRRCAYVGKYCKRRLRMGFIRVCIENREVYCCFNSAFSRILVEQLREAHPTEDFGTPKEPNCRGYGIEEIRTMNSRGLDLSEWYAMEYMAGRYPGRRPPPDGGGQGGGSTLASAGGREPLQIRISATEMLEHHMLSPRRGIPGSTMSAAGPQGMVHVRDRVAERVARNRQAMETSRNRLAQAGTAVFHEELMPWYAPTTQRANPPRNPNLTLPDDLGGDSEDVPTLCDTRGPPAGWARVEYDVHGQQLDGLFGLPGQSRTTIAFIDQGQYISIPIDVPTTGQSSWVAVWPTHNWAANPPQQVAREALVTISRCPGDFAEDEQTCHRRAHSIRPWVPGDERQDWWMWFLDSSNPGWWESCQYFQPGSRIYVNIFSRLQDPEEPGCPFNKVFCGIRIHWQNDQ